MGCALYSQIYTPPVVKEKCPDEKEAGTIGDRENIIPCPFNFTKCLEANCTCEHAASLVREMTCLLTQEQSIEGTDHLDFLLWDTKTQVHTAEEMQELIEIEQIVEEVNQVCEHEVELTHEGAYYMQSMIVEEEEEKVEHTPCTSMYNKKTASKAFQLARDNLSALVAKES
jgi:hypothetical protein